MTVWVGPDAPGGEERRFEVTRYEILLHPLCSEYPEDLPPEEGKKKAAGSCRGRMVDGYIHTYF